MKGLLSTKKTHCVYSVFGIWSRIASVLCVMSTLSHGHLADSFIFVKQSEPWLRFFRGSSPSTETIQAQAGTALKFICPIVDCVVFIRRVPVTSRPECVCSTINFSRFLSFFEAEFLVSPHREQRTIAFIQNSFPLLLTPRWSHPDWCQKVSNQYSVETS